MMIEQLEAINRILQKIETPQVRIENNVIYIEDRPISIDDERYLDTVESAIINILMGKLGQALDDERRHHESMVDLNE